MKKSDQKILRQITAEAWGRYGDKLFVDREKAGVMKEVLDKSLTKHRDMFDENQLDKMQSIKESGMLEGTERVEDPKVAKKYHEYVEKRIGEEIKKGNLSKPEKAFKKGKQYARRSTKN